MNLGDKVSVLNDDITGQVIAVEGDKISVLTSDEFEMDFERSELVVIGDFITEEKLSKGSMAKALQDEAEKKKRKSARVRPKDRVAPAMEVDLHIEKLVRQFKQLSNYDILTIQLDTAKRQLDFAIGKRIQRIVFIHGVGDGVLKADLDSLLRRYEGIKFYDADYKKYGRGATEVYILQRTTA